MNIFRQSKQQHITLACTCCSNKGLLVQCGVIKCTPLVNMLFPQGINVILYYGRRYCSFFQVFDLLYIFKTEKECVGRFLKLSRYSDCCFCSIYHLQDEQSLGVFALFFVTLRISINLFTFKRELLEIIEQCTNCIIDSTFSFKPIKMSNFCIKRNLLRTEKISKKYTMAKGTKKQTLNNSSSNIQGGSEEISVPIKRYNTLIEHRNTKTLQTQGQP